jgi:pimeloyl-ACP methyl ester carboxylesterase/DNA-binding CsgD family transcriptional regulator
MNRSAPSVRFTRSFDGVRLAHASVGRGPHLVKAATWLTHLELEGDGPVWGHWVRELSRDHTYVRYDERGCGLSDWIVEELSFESWVRDLETVVDALGIDRFALLGVSQGAAIAIDYAVRHPERVSHLVLHGGYARGRLVRGNTPAQREEAETMAKLAELGWGKSDAAFRQFFTSQFIPGGTLEQHQWFNEVERISCSPSNAARFMRAFDKIDVVDLLPRVQCPTLVLHSVEDARVPFEEGRLIATRIPNARFVSIASRNHLLLEAEPGWAHWLDEVRHFLPKTPTHEGVFSALTTRQREVLDLLAQGRDNTQIAATLGLAEKTVRNCVTAIFARIGVDSRAQAIVAARESGFGETER